MRQPEWLQENLIYTLYSCMLSKSEKAHQITFVIYDSCKQQQDFAESQLQFTFNY